MPNKASSIFRAMRATLLLFIGLNIIAAASAASEWEEHGITLKWGENFSFYDYNITAADFRPGTIEEQPEKCKNETGSINRKIYGCDDYVFLRVSKDGNSVLETALTKENHTFVDGAEFYNETAYEDNEISLKIIALDVVTGYNLPSPFAILNIKIKNNTNEIAELNIAKNLTINKIVSRDANVNPCNQFIPVKISVENIGIFDFPSIRVDDRAGDDFISEPHDLNWSISLDRGGIWQAEYKIRPLKPIAGAEYNLPPAVLYITYHGRTYNLPTDKRSFILHSSDIILSKTAEVKDGGNITIGLNVINNGSRAAMVKVRDSLLPGMEIVAGDMNFSLVLQPGISYSQIYWAKMNNISANISLPPANFTFDEYRSCYDAEGNGQAITGSGISNPVQIKPTDADPLPVQTISALPVEETSTGISPDAAPSGNLTSGALSVGGYKIPYTYLLLLAGALLVSVILFMLKVWKLLGLFK